MVMYKSTTPDPSLLRRGNKSTTTDNSLLWWGNNSTTSENSLLRSGNNTPVYYILDSGELKCH